MKYYYVCGPQGVNDAKPGERIELDPEDPVTERLLEREQISIKKVTLPDDIPTEIRE